VVVDPPRAGLSQKIVRRVIECGATKIVYVSCNPTTLAPNAVQLGEAGYRLARVRPVDMFPQTPHIECVALFERNAPDLRQIPPLLGRKSGAVRGGSKKEAATDE
jgi:23S rRNA (uracil1939-C5)-methyltransferase